jgi:hypothetical protein
MTDRIDDTPFNARTGRNHELSVGAGASIVIVVAATLALMVTLLFASLTPTRAAEITPAAYSVETAQPAGKAHAFVAAPPRDTSYFIAPPAGTSGSLSAIVVMAVLAGWLAVSADLWRALFNRVKSWDRSRS